MWLGAVSLTLCILTGIQDGAPPAARLHAQELAGRAAALAKQRGRESDAIALYREALASWGVAGDVQQAARTLLVIGRLEAITGRKAEAGEAFGEAARLFHQIGDAGGEADAHYGIARQQFDRFDTAGAIASYEKAVALERRGEDRFGLALALHNLAAARREAGDSAGAMDHFREALAIRASINDRPGVGYTLYGIAAIYWARGDAEQALRTYSEALANWRTIGDRTAEANTLNGMGLAYQALGDRTRAAARYREALVSWRAAKNVAGEGYTLNNIAMADAAAGRSGPAQQTYQRALDLLRTAKDLRGQAYVLHNLGDLRMRRGDPDQARRLYDESLALKRQLNDRFGEAYTLQRIGEALLAAGDPAGALARAEQARDLHRLVADRPGEAAALAAAARAQEALHQRDAARTTMAQAVGTIERLRVDVANEELRASYFATHQDYYEYFIGLLMRSHADTPAAGHDRAALDMSERTRSRVLLDRLTGGRTESGGPGPVTERQRLAVRIKEEMAWVREAAQTGRRADATRLDALLAEYDALDRSSADGAGLTSIADPPFDLVRLRNQALDRDSGLLEFSLGKEGSYAWLITTDAVTAVSLPRRAVIDRAVGRYLGALRARSILTDTTAAARAARIARADADLPSAARALARIVLAPFEKHFTGRRLVIAGDGTLRGVPFAALPLADGSLVLTRYEVVTVASAALAIALRTNASPSPRPATVAVLADPVFSCDDARAPEGAACPDPPLPRLRYSEVEAAAIRGVVERSVVRSGFDASLAALGSAAFRRADVLHFATHAVVDEVVPARSRIVLTRIDQRGRVSDDALDLAAIASLDVSASTIVLSACRTALGAPLPGEGLLGLSRAFFLAGARRVVATLWEVQDRATSELMRRFYAAMFERGLAPAAALRDAQLGLAASERWRHPYYWAGAALNGDWH